VLFGEHGFVITEGELGAKNVGRKSLPLPRGLIGILNLVTFPFEFRRRGHDARRLDRASASV
jgi:hypothetical protein